MLEIIFSSVLIVVLMDWSLTINFMMICGLMLIFMLHDCGEYLLKLIMVMLSFWLVLLMMMVVSDSDKSLELFMIFMFLLISLQFVFYVDSLMMFYFAFEITALPMLLMIFGWGYQPDRLEAGMYMLCYTVIFSLPLLVGIYFIDSMIKSIPSVMMFFMLTLAFMVKFPMVGLHMWLPRAHVEAPAFGSMILAGVMLKLGGYGLIKLSYLIGDLIVKFSGSLVILSIMGGLIMSGICFTQSDMKMMIAYSSIVHMSLVLSGILSMHEMGLKGSIFMMIGHGLCSSGLFCILGVTYNRTHSRSFYLNKGLLTVIPIMSMWWFMFCSSNLSFPPCLNLPGELFLFGGIISWSSKLIPILLFLGCFSSMYSIYLFSFSQHGWLNLSYSFSSFYVKESLLMVLHWMPLNMIILDLSLLVC
uniref:NADH-ubiquinone oxidoreductase chain 4 n=1 Tax=Livia junci TaxID=1449964 RepID=A0A344A2J1_9HEMI|nr:NADH dehydrogenase subunit 4 [Livia junci]AWU48982.1 NADH dehydrogenase subunit 4 [Livia junci]